MGECQSLRECRLLVDDPEKGAYDSPPFIDVCFGRHYWGNVEASAFSAMIIRSSSRIGRNLALRLNIGNLSDDTDAISLPHLYFIIIN